MVNKKRLLFIIVIASMLLAVGISVRCLVYSQSGERVLKGIKPEHTKSVFVRTGELEPYELSNEEKEIFFSLLLELTIYQKDKSKENPIGTTFACYVIEMNNGKRVEIIPTDSLIYINGERYWLERDSYKTSSELEDMMTNLRDEHIWKDTFEHGNVE